MPKISNQTCESYGFRGPGDGGWGGGLGILEMRVKGGEGLGAPGNLGLGLRPRIRQGKDSGLGPGMETKSLLAAMVGAGAEKCSCRCLWD